MSQSGALAWAVVPIERPSRGGSSHRDPPKCGGAPKGPPKGSGVNRGPPRGGHASMGGQGPRKDHGAKWGPPRGSKGPSWGPPRAAIPRRAFPRALPGATAIPGVLLELAALSRALPDVEVPLGTLTLAAAPLGGPPKGSGAPSGPS
ncbi:collagen alpha-2(I) chain-like [Homarus americanus]|uniref:collagen alpha-2(I) chain-like n=1 Tax=Homarus americanus TaxID=6706 RepID=UPI001C463636|nr:collagen alpha-2(I) chain-like [Homarus americanus]